MRFLVSILLVIALVAGTLLFLRTNAGKPGAAYADAVYAGAAYYENRQLQSSIDKFKEAVSLRPKLASSYRNLARPYVQRAAEEDANKAMVVLEEAIKLSPDHVATNYLVGLSLKKLGRFEEAATCLKKAVAGDPNEAVLHFQLGLVEHNLDNIDSARAHFEKTVALDPLHLSVHYRLGNYARLDGDMKRFRNHFREHKRLKDLFGDNGGAEWLLEACRYTKAELPPKTDDLPSSRDTDVTFVRADSKPLAGQFTDVRCINVMRTLPERGYEVVVVTQDKLHRLSFGPGEGTEDEFAVDVATVATMGSTEPVDIPDGVHACVVGDFYNPVPEGEDYDPKLDQWNDLLLLSGSGVQLLERQGPASFSDVTERAGLRDVRADAARWVDFDHDGDLDLALGNESGLRMWQNNGDGTLSDVTDTAGIPGLKAVTRIEAIDFENDVAVDLLVLQADGTLRELRNNRVGSYSLSERKYDDVVDFAVNDIENDCLMELVALHRDGLKVYPLDPADSINPEMPSGIARDSGKLLLLDFDNDTWLDVLAYGVGGAAGEAGRSRPVVYAGLGRGDSKKGDSVVADSGEKVFADSSGVDANSLLSMDVDGDGDSDLLMCSKSGVVDVLLNKGGNKNDQVRLTFLTLKTNPSGFDTEVQLWDEGMRLARPTGDRGFIEVGLGRRNEVTSLRTLWGNGVVDHQIDQDVRKSIQVAERDVAIGSCPFLYVWDGAKFRFVTDILGNSPIGLSLRRGEALPADPDEYVYVGTDANVGTREGDFVLAVTEEFREVMYLDAAEFVAVDHPADVEIHATDKLMPEPFPASELWALANGMVPSLVASSDGLDRTAALSAIDGLFAPPGELLPPPYRGMCRPLSLTMEFDRQPTENHRVLALTGWIHYGDASTNIALSQQRAYEVIPPMLEARVDGAWQAIDVVVGMPAGKTKTILVDLEGRVPNGFDALRLTTTFELRWDRIALMERYPGGDVFVTRAKPRQANLHWHGFAPLVSRAPQHPTTPVYSEAVDQPAWRTTPQGWCTRYGDVLPLVGAVDDRLVLANAGDAVELAFSAPDAAVQEGLVRSYFFYSFGWEKDGDHNVVGGDRVLPLPASDPASDVFFGMSREEVFALEEHPMDWRLEYNTRWVDEHAFDEARRDRFGGGRTVVDWAGAVDGSD